MMQKKKAEINQFAQTSVNRLVKSGLTYANAVTSAADTNTPSFYNAAKTEWMVFMQDESSKLFGLTLVQTMKKVNEFMCTNKNIKVLEEKQIAFITFLMGLCQK